MSHSNVSATSPSSGKRSVSLDALRGFAILTMVLSGVIPFKILPGWMYHAQIPPPDHVFNPNLPGLTWVDLVFPMFLFALGTAIPLAIGKRQRLGNSTVRIVFYILERSFLLLFFAIFLRHVRPHVLNPNPDWEAWLTGLIGFVIMFAIFLRFPEAWSRKWTLVIRYSGWAVAGLMLYVLEYPDGSGFSLERSNIIILVLANVYLFGSLIWLITSDKPFLRLGILGILIGLRLAHSEPGWVNWVWNATPVPWFYKLYYLQYLFIVLPGTLIGDFFVRWHQVKNGANEQAGKWNPAVFSGLSFTIVLMVLTLLVGLQARWTTATAIIVLAGCLGMFLMSRNPANEFEALIHKLLSWGIYWMVLGLVFEPFEGGIKKDHPTLSYYFVTTGISIWILTVFTIISDYWKHPGWLSLLSDNGKNPMIAYVGIANFIWPVLGLLGIDHIIERLTQGAILGLCRALFYTFLLALMVRFFSRKKLFWRT